MELVDSASEKRAKQARLNIDSVDNDNNLIIDTGRNPFNSSSTSTPVYPKQTVIESAFLSDEEEEQEQEESLWKGNEHGVSVMKPQRASVPLQTRSRKRRKELYAPASSHMHQTSQWIQQQQPKPKLCLCSTFTLFLLIVVFGIAAAWFAAPYATSYYGKRIITQQITNTIRYFQKEILAPIGIDDEFSLWLQKHNTTSAEVDYRTHAAKQSAKLLKSVFYQHFRNNTDLNCLCMHHLHMDILAARTGNPLRLYRLCALMNRSTNQIYMMANPTIKGGSKSKTWYKEHSVACDGQSVDRERADALMIEWREPQSEKAMYMLAQGKDAACMQLALDEMMGKVECA